jgi:hypothetical protein
MNSAWLALLMTATLVSSLAVGFYWLIVFPVIRRKMAFRIENNLDSLRLMGLRGQVEACSKSYAKVQHFLVSARNAAFSAQWIAIRPMTKEESHAHEYALRELINDSDQYTPEVEGLVRNTMDDLVGLFFAQRPMVICVMMPIFALATWWGAAREVKEQKEVEYAAASLSGGCVV